MITQEPKFTPAPWDKVGNIIIKYEPVCCGGYDAAGITPELATHSELLWAINLIDEAQKLDSAARDTLRAAYINGPLFDGDVPSKVGRTNLIKKGLIAKVVIKGVDGFNACTQRGFWVKRVLDAIDSEVKDERA